jgi:hypothetical protein
VQALGSSILSLTHRRSTDGVADFATTRHAAHWAETTESPVACAAHNRSAESPYASRFNGSLQLSHRLGRRNA